MPFMCCSPFANRQPFQCVHSADVFSGQSKFERIRSGTLTVIPPRAANAVRTGAEITMPSTCVLHRCSTAACILFSSTLRTTTKLTNKPAARAASSMPNRVLAGP